MLISGLVIGIVLGFILQRGQFCLSGHLRQIAFKRDAASISPLLTVIAIQSIGFYILEKLHIIHIPQSPMPWGATLLGAFLFGLGMGVANRCISGQLYRAGEGMIAAIITLMIFAITTVMTQTGLLRFWVAAQLQTQSQWVTIPQTLHISSIYLIVPLCVLAAWLAYKSTQQQKIWPTHFLQSYWPAQFTALLLGLLSIIAWALSAQTGREFGLSFSIPVGHALQYMLLGQQRYLNWGTYLVIGVVAGAYISAKISGTFQWKAVSAQDFVKSCCGGLFMGVGAALAGGCTMANAVVGTAYFSWQGWIATMVMIGGVWCVFAWRKNPLQATC